MGNKVSFIVFSIVFLSFLSCTDGGYFSTQYGIAISCVDSSKQETFVLVYSSKDSNDYPYEKKSICIDTDYYNSFSFGFHVDDYSSLKEELSFQVSTCGESLGHEAYVLVLPSISEITTNGSFPSELFPDGDIYSYLEDEELFHGTLQTLYENGYWCIKKLTPENSSVSFTLKEALGE